MSGQLQTLLRRKLSIAHATLLKTRCSSSTAGLERPARTASPMRQFACAAENLSHNCGPCGVHGTSKHRNEYNFEAQ